MTSPATVPAAPASAPHRWRPVQLIGLLPLLPGLALLVVSYVIPTVSMVVTSFQSAPLLGERRWSGLDNYRLLWDIGYPRSFWVAASAMIWPLLTITVVGLILAYLANRAGWGARWLVRVVLALPMVAIAPTAFAVAWRLDRAGFEAGFDEQAVQRLTQSAVALTMFGLLVGVGTTVYLATLRHRESTSAGIASLVAAALMALTTLAIGFQLYSYPLVLTRGVRDTETPLLFVYLLAFRSLDLGTAAAASTLLLIALAVLGVLAVLLAITTQLRIEVSPHRWNDTPDATDGQPQPATAPGSRAAARHPEAVIGTLLVLLAVVAVTGYGLWPWLSRVLQFRDHASAAQILVNTWAPPLIGTAVGMVAAVLAGFAIGMLRPLGRYSPGLLLLFAPWLFVGNGALGVVEYRFLVELELVDTFVAMIPPGWVVVPAVVLFTLLFRGQEPRWRQLRAGGKGAAEAAARALILPAVPMFVLVGAATWLVQAQSLFWNQIVVPRPGRSAGPAMLLDELLRFGADGGSELSVGLVLPFAVVMAFATGLAVLQVTYLDRVAIRAAAPADQPGPGRTMGR